jgi:2-dehydro-3-deoxyphosphogluconate aldolase / (4S)-4-hydroxy-2-oxoglutarate aldolase
MEILIEQLEELGIIPVIEIERSQDAVPLAHALIEGGLPLAEITFRTASAEAAIRSITNEFPEMIVGAGTVLNPDQAGRAVDAGARFVVSPGFSPSVVRFCLERDMPVFPGVATPTDIIQALEYDLTLLKFFPAETLGGIPVLKSLSGPFNMVRFIPTGGITHSNFEAYLDIPSVFACGGSWIAPRKLISTGNFVEITRLAAEAVQVVRNIRKKKGLVE